MPLVFVFLSLLALPALAADPAPVQIHTGSPQMSRPDLAVPVVPRVIALTDAHSGVTVARGPVADGDETGWLPASGVFEPGFSGAPCGPESLDLGGPGSVPLP